MNSIDMATTIEEAIRSQERWARSKAAAVVVAPTGDLVAFAEKSAWDSLADGYKGAAEIVATARRIEEKSAK